MKRLFSYLAVAAALLCSAGTLSAQTKLKAPVRQGWDCTTEFYKIGTQVYGFQNDPLYGDIESIEEICFLPHGGDFDYTKLDEGSVFRTIYKFNKRGDVVECVEDWPQGVTCSYEYDAKRRMTKSTELYDGCTTTTYEYDSQDKLVREIKYFVENDLTLIYTYKYDKNNNLVLKERLVDGELSYPIIREYDAQNRLVSNIEYDDEEGGFESYRYVYDASNRVVEGYSRNYEGKEMYKLIYKYDAAGRLVDIYDESNGVCEKRYTFVYDKSGVLLGFIGPYGVIQPPYPDFQHILTLNSKGEAVKSYFHGIEEITRYYERDAKGNVVKYIDYYGNEKEPYRCTIRKIKYRK